ncbi:YihA family ribosome biogenesis GTP-binding protein [Candidatus Uhrbacteria bacterium]|nr:YihA family ribosome biogenesis GTP-binding protein [Candidatus Uhrbacteria bacterium]
MKSSFIRSYSDPAMLPKEGLPQVAFLGRSNAGKSSLINSLTDSKNLARVSATPGLTRLINIFDVAGKFHLVDLPGYGYAKMSRIEREGLTALIHDYLSTSKLLQLAVVIVDSRIGPTKDDRELIDSLHQADIPFILVANKVDKLSRTELSQIMSTLQVSVPGVPIVAHSSVTGAGSGELYEEIVRYLSASKA